MMIVIMIQIQDIDLGFDCLPMLNTFDFVDYGFATPFKMRSKTMCWIPMGLKTNISNI